MSIHFSPYFYVTLKDDFQERLEENEEAGLFPELENPYKAAKKRLTRGRVYPVVEIRDRHLVILDDTGKSLSAFRSLFKFAQD